MDNLEEFIKENREHFDRYEPGDEVWDRISARRERHKIGGLNWSSILWKAAAVIVILATSLISWDYFSHRHGSQDQLQADNKQEIVIPELREAEVYYTGQINDKLNEVNRVATGFPDIRLDVARDMKELDSVYVELKKDLKDGAASEEVVAAMIQNYRTKLRVLEDILSILHRSKNNEKNNKKSYEL